MPRDEPADLQAGEDAHERPAPAPAEPAPAAAAFDGVGAAGRPEQETASGETVKNGGVGVPRRRQAGGDGESPFGRQSSVKSGENRSDAGQPIREPELGRKDGKADRYALRRDAEETEAVGDEPTAPDTPAESDLEFAKPRPGERMLREGESRGEKVARQPKGVARRLSMTRHRDLTDLAKRKMMIAGAPLQNGVGAIAGGGTAADEEGSADLMRPAPAVRPPEPAGAAAGPRPATPEPAALPAAPQKLVRVLFVLQNAPPMADIAAEVPTGPPTAAAAATRARQAEVGAEAIEADAVMEAAAAPPEE
jgi:hypothetical protein